MTKLRCIKEFDMENGSKAPFTNGSCYTAESTNRSNYYILTNDDGLPHYMFLGQHDVSSVFDGRLHFELIEE